MLLALAICLATAAVSHEIGFSPALGAFLAGISISGSRDLHFAHEQLLPLRDAFVAIFFVSIGSLIEPQLLLHSLPLVGAMLALIVVGKFLIWAAVVRLFRYPLNTAIAVAAGLTQIGELSFVVVQVARGAGLVDENVFVSTLAASLISIFLNVLIVRLIWPCVCPPIPPQSTPPQPISADPPPTTASA
jgi:CPA2 family monovalent cation:H+ antiporter-2